MDRPPWQGLYFDGMPIEIVAHAMPGWVFRGWTGGRQSKQSPPTLDLSEETQLTALFEREEDVQD